MFNASTLSHRQPSGNMLCSASAQGHSQPEDSHNLKHSQLSSACMHYCALMTPLRLFGTTEKSTSRQSSGDVGSSPTADRRTVYGPCRFHALNSA